MERVGILVVIVIFLLAYDDRFHAEVLVGGCEVC